MDGVQHVRIGAHQDGLGRGIVLGLGKQVQGEPLRRRGVVGNHEHLAGARNDVDADGAENQALGGRDVSPAGTDDLVHLGNRRRAVGQSGDSLGAAHGKHPIHARRVSCREHQRRTHAIRRGDSHDDLTNASHPGGHGRHQHRRRVCSLAPRDVQAHPLQSRHPLAEQVAVTVGVFPVPGQLVGVIIAYTLGGQVQRFTVLGAQGIERGFELRRRNLKRRGARALVTIVPGGERQEGIVATHPHRLDDLGRRARHLVFQAGLPLQEPGETLREVRIARG